MSEQPKETGYWWSVKVFDAESGTYTWLEKFAETAKEAEAQIDRSRWAVVPGKTYHRQTKNRTHG